MGVGTFFLANPQFWLKMNKTRKPKFPLLAGFAHSLVPHNLLLLYGSKGGQFHELFISSKQH